LSDNNLFDQLCAIAHALAYLARSTPYGAHHDALAALSLALDSLIDQVGSGGPFPVMPADVAPCQPPPTPRSDVCDT